MNPYAMSEAPVVDFGPPEKREVTIGFVALSDCASVVMARHLGLFERYGLEVTLKRQPSWAALRDRLYLGEIDVAHLLYSTAYALDLGVAGPQIDMAILMGLNCNGQGIVLSERLLRAGVVDALSLCRLVRSQPAALTFAQTFPTGTHAIWLYYWLAQAGIDPKRDVRMMTMPPRQMPEAMQSGRIDGYCAGEPYGGSRIAAAHGGFKVAASAAIWPDHPDKVMAASRSFVKRYPATSRALIAAVLESARYCDDPGHHAHLASVLAGPKQLDVPAETIQAAFDFEPDVAGGGSPLRFFGDGLVTHPFASDGMWFLTQLVRLGFAGEDIDYRQVANAVTQTGLYREVAKAMGVPLPEDVDRSVRLLGGDVWDARDVDGALPAAR